MGLAHPFFSTRGGAYWRKKMAETESEEEGVLKCVSPDYKFPEVLQRTPRCLIALSGLDVTNNAVHRLVWDEFSSGIKRSDRRPILFKNIPANYIYPKCGPDRTTYEDYALQGILKTSWLSKHCEELPALVAFFFDLDWNDPQWEERQTECVSKVEVIRSALQNRATEIVIVLLQSTPPLPMGEASNINSERAATLCAACELPRLNLFVLPFSQRPQGFIIKIEEAFYKKATQYYTNKIHTVRAHKDMVANKQSLQLLFIRHNFKMAFFAEMKQEPSLALKYYRAAYTHLLENMYLSDDRAMEFKMIAGFMNYKICRLFFETSDPREAITQFRTHIDRFSKEVGIKHLAYEHYEWLSRQFCVFADLFREALQRGLKGLKTQNAGLYYYQAALHAIQRKRLTGELNLDLHNTQVLSALPQVNYYGQRPWRKSLTDDKPSNMELRQMCIVTMQKNEKAVEHSWQIIPLLTQAIFNLKSYKCERLITYLRILMAEEYHLVKDYGRSYVLINGVVEVYRTEQWWNNLTSILLKLLRCAYLLGYVQEYVTIGLELISRYFPLEISEKKRILQNITEVFTSSCPYPEPNLSSDEIQSANVAWAESWKNQVKGIAIQLSSLASCVECKTSFMRQSYAADQQVKVQVFLCSNAPLPLKLQRLAIAFTDEESNSSCIHGDEFILEPGIVKVFNFSFLPRPSSVGKAIEVHSVEAVLHCRNSEDNGCVSPVLLWSNGVSETFSSKPGDLLWQKIELRNTVFISPRPPNVSISLDHAKPALIGEYYSVSVRLTNQESAPITDVNIKFSLPDSLDIPQLAVEMFEKLPSSPSYPLPPNMSPQFSSLEVSCPELQLDSGKSVSTKKIYLCCHAVGTRTMAVTVSYHISCHVDGMEEAIDCYCEKDYIEALEVLKPFEIQYKVMSTKFKPTEFVSHKLPFILMTELTCTATCELTITGSKVELNKGVVDVGENFSQVEGLLMEPGDHATECFCLMSSSSHVSKVLVGKYTVRWNRRNSSIPQDIASSVTFPPINANYQICTLSADLPAYGEQMQVFQLSYTIHNLSPFVQEFETKLGPSDAFMYSGNRLCQFRILPMSEHMLTFNLLPVVTGFTLLPSLELSYMQDGEKKPDLMLMNNVPTSILIKPSPVRTNANLDITLS